MKYSVFTLTISNRLSSEIMEDIVNVFVFFSLIVDRYMILHELLFDINFLLNEFLEFLLKNRRFGEFNKSLYQITKSLIFFLSHYIRDNLSDVTSIHIY